MVGVEVFGELLAKGFKGRRGIALAVCFENLVKRMPMIRNYQVVIV